VAAVPLPHKPTTSHSGTTHTHEQFTQSNSPSIKGVENNPIRQNSQEGSVRKPQTTLHFKQTSKRDVNMYNEQEGTRPTAKRETFLSMRTFSEGNSLSVSDATRELTKCANGQLVSHDIVRDGIDGLLQLKRASYDITPTEEHTNMAPWGADGLRTRPEPPFTVPSQDHRDHRQQNDAEDSDDDDDCSTCRSNSPDPDHRRISENIKPVSKSTHGHVKVGKAKPLRRPPPPKKPAKSTKPTRPPTIWHSRKSDPPQPNLLVPDSPKSKTSHESTYNSDENESDEADETTPAVLHFSCIQCHRAKKRCNRTRPCTRCISRGLENECRYPDKHDPRSVLRACLRCWQTKKKCDRKQPCCGKCDKVGVKCVYRREQNDQEVPPSPFSYDDSERRSAFFYSD
jgi:hypothetical protein